MVLCVLILELHIIAFFIFAVITQLRKIKINEIITHDSKFYPGTFRISNIIEHQAKKNLLIFFHNVHKTVVIYYRDYTGQYK